VTQYAYDVLGNRTVITDADGLFTHYVYDGLNRLTRIDYPATILHSPFSILIPHSWSASPMSESLQTHSMTLLKKAYLNRQDARIAKETKE
jgi:hypothetical protein